MARIPGVRDFFGYLVQQNTFLYGILTCQFISNVPSALLLSNFVTDYKDLLYAVNIGGIGTLISSLASLITFREYVKHEPKKGLRYLGLFTVVNVSFLGILIVLVMFAT
ncbi:MAG: citrate transporter [Acutalibacteraceae bacterium]